MLRRQGSAAWPTAQQPAPSVAALAWGILGTGVLGGGTLNPVNVAS